MKYLKILLKRTLSSISIKLRKIYLQFKYIDSTIHSKALLNIENINKFHLGRYSRIGAYSVIIVAEDPNNRVFNSNIWIGDNTYIGEFNNIRAAGGYIVIGDNCLISQHVTIVASNHSIKKDQLIRTQPWKMEKSGIIIGNDVWIGANTVLLPGIKIGNGVVIGSGSVVTKDIPDFAICYGNPAKVNRYRE